MSTDGHTERYDVIVVGLGAMGSHAVRVLAERGVRVLGVDRYAPPHTMGSSHGDARIIREAYFEDPLYVPLVQRAYRAWDALAAATGTTLFRQTGGLMIGAPDSVLVQGALASARQHQLPHDILDADALHARFPVWTPRSHEVAVYEPRAGILFPERCVAASLARARAAGAALWTDTRVEGVELTADGGAQIVAAERAAHAARVILAAGAWMNDLLASLPGQFTLPLVVQGNIQHWFLPTHAQASLGPDQFPIFIYERPGQPAWYGFPDVGDGVKIGRHHWGEIGHPDTLSRSVSAQDIAGMRPFLEETLPSANGTCRASSVCFYTNTPDEHFVIGPHPEHPAILIASPCSGHGFKFSVVIGELLADLAVGRTPDVELSVFSPARFV